MAHLSMNQKSVIAAQGDGFDATKTNNIHGSKCAYSRQRLLIMIDNVRILPAQSLHVSIHSHVYAKIHASDTLFPSVSLLFVGSYSV